MDTFQKSNKCHWLAYFTMIMPFSTCLFSKVIVPTHMFLYDNYAIGFVVSNEPLLAFNAQDYNLGPTISLWQMIHCIIWTWVKSIGW